MNALMRVVDVGMNIDHEFDGGHHGRRYETLANVID